MEACLPPRVDLVLLTNNMGGNSKVLPKLFEVFWQGCADYTKRMEKALSKKDVNEWQAAAHALKGAALSVTARRVASMCDEAEHMFKLKNKEGLALLYHLHKEIVILKNEVAAQIA